MEKMIILIFAALSAGTVFIASGPQWACISQDDAEKVLRQKAKQIESRSEKVNGILQYICTYQAVSEDRKTGKTGILYYIAEEYLSADAAKKSFASIVSGNKNHEGFMLLKSVGDEALSHTDNTGFQLVLVRKGKRMIRLKVNKITSYTAPIETLQAVAKRTTAGL